MGGGKIERARLKTQRAKEREAKRDEKQRVCVRERMTEIEREQKKERNRKKESSKKGRLALIESVGIYSIIVS